MKLFYKIIHRLVRWIMRIFFGMKVTGEANVPRDGRIIIASNHISGFDPPAVGVATDRELHFLAKKELFAIPLLGAVIRRLNAYPVDRGAGDIKALKTFISLLNQNNAIILFPEGTRSRDGELGKAKEGVGMLAMRTKSDIIPVYISGTRKIRRAILRKPRVQIKFGHRIYLEKYSQLKIDDRARYQQISNDTLEEIRRLRDENNH